MEGGKYNLRNPAVKRIMQEMKELQKDPTSDFKAAALEDNIFEWHFAVRGPPDTEFEGGIYHGRILLPPEYPFKPPSFLLLTPNGRFETGVKICLSISSHHPEHWQPSWSVRTALVALVAFFPTPGNGAIGSIDFPKEERAVLAAKSRAAPPQFGSPERQRVTDEVHAAMLAAAAPAANPELGAEARAAAAQAAAARFSPPPSPAQLDTSTEQEQRRSEAATAAPPAAAAALPQATPPVLAPVAVQAAPAPVATAGASQPNILQELAQARAARAAAAAAAQPAPPPVQAAPVQHAAPLPPAQRAAAAPGVDRLTLLAGVLTALIAAIVLRRILIIGGFDVASL